MKSGLSNRLRLESLKRGKNEKILSHWIDRRTNSLRRRRWQRTDSGTYNSARCHSGRLLGRQRLHGRRGSARGAGERGNLGRYTSGGSIVGALYGNTSSSGTTLSGSGKDFNIPSRTVASGTYTGTFAAKSSINVTTSSGSTFSGAYKAAYDQPASLAAVAGTFSGAGVSGSSSVQPISVTVSSSGAITVPSSLGCSATGTTTLRPSGKNILDVTVTFKGSTCALGDGVSTTGIAYYDATNGHMLVMAMNAAKSDGFIYVGQK
jgi:hypothetical protein